MVSVQSSEDTYGDSDKDVADVDVSSSCNEMFTVLEGDRPGDEVLLDNEVLFILVGSVFFCCGFMSDSEYFQPSISEKCNAFEDCEDCEECVDEDKELLVVTEEDLEVLELFESLSEELGSFDFGVFANVMYCGE